MTLQEAYQKGEQLLIQAGIQDARLDAWYLMEYVTGMNRAMYYAMPDKLLPEKLERQYWNYIEQRSRHIPLQHLTGVQEFMGLEFFVNEHVLIPRQDTEILVETALHSIKQYTDIEGHGHELQPFNVLDMCTGSGCILLSILHYARQGSNRIFEGTGADISEKALETACANAKALQIKATFKQTDLFEKIEGRYKLIVSNPPYIRTEVIESLQEEVKLYDPRIALDGKEDGLFFYRRIIEESGAYLEKGGSLIFEIGADQGAVVQAMMLDAGYKKVCIKKDLSGLDRVVIGVYDR